MRLPGLVAVAFIAAAAQLTGSLAPLIGAPVLALVAGLVVRNTVGPRAALRDGADFTLKRLLRLAIILFGATLSFQQVVTIGAAAATVIAATIVLALGLVAALGRALRAPRGLVSLIGVGTAICGATAIITVGPIIESREEEIAFAVTTVFLFNMLAVLVYPLLGHLLALSDAVFGLWAGTAIHDTSSVLAAAFAFSEPAGRVATVVKLTRTLALVPLAVLYGIVHSTTRRVGHGGLGARVDLIKIFPWFVLWFVAAAAMNSLHLFGAAAVRWASLVGRFLVVMVMAAVGLSADLGRMRQIGLGPFYVGLAASVTIAAVSMVLIRLLAR
ncbi:MAG: putative sulfate exporter family transporter [Armatimonadota bacterium]|nr:putative sulfate exporter family transporter [Armatimonadota bacterium]